jgi:Tol biopolymer transport system component
VATVQTKITRNVYLLPGAGSQSAQFPPLPSTVRDIQSLNWTADGNLVASDGARLTKMGPDGKNPAPILADLNADISGVSACGDRYLIFEWGFHAGTNSSNIWRVNTDGSNAIRLTGGKDDHFPTCSPDQKWVYYNDRRAVQMGRVPLDASGKPEPIPGSTNFHGFTGGGEISISADGKTLAYTAVSVTVGGADITDKIALLNLESPTSPRLLNANPHISGGVQFTPDAKSVAYSIRENGVDNLWVQPLDGFAGHQITNFASDQIDSFHWSPDGKSLAILRRHSESDVVLLQESKP